MKTIKGIKNIILVFAICICCFLSTSLAGPLHYAVMDGNIDEVEQLIAMGADVNENDSFLFTPLHCAAIIGNKDIAELLIAKGADINAKNQYDATPLHKALDAVEPLNNVLDNNHKAVVLLLVNKGADVNSIGYTLLLHCT